MIQWDGITLTNVSKRFFFCKLTMCWRILSVSLYAEPHPLTPSNGGKEHAWRPFAEERINSLRLLLLRSNQFGDAF